MLTEAKRASGLLLLAALLAACADKPGAGPYMGGQTNFGAANRLTMAAQVIDPSPTYATRVPETSGDHAAQADARYRADKVKRPARASDPTFGGGTTPP